MYRLIRILSLDIVAGVASSAVLACKLLGVAPPPIYFMLLPLSVWILYLADHLADGIRQANRQQASRYQFYYLHRKAFTFLLTIVALVGILLLVRFYDKTIFLFGGSVSLLIVLYFAGQQLRFKRLISAFPKELLIALGYSWGIWGVPVLLSHHPGGELQLLGMCSFLLIVLMNVLIYSLYEEHGDRVYGYSSLAIKMGQLRLTKLITVLAGFNFAADAMILLFARENMWMAAGTLFMLMGLTLVAIARNPQLFAKHSLYGIIADALFLLPAFVWFT